MKFHIRTRLSESFIMMHRFWKCSQEKLHFIPVQTCTLIEAWWSAVSTTSEGCKVSSEVQLENCTQVWGWAKFGQRATHDWEKIALHTCSELSRPVEPVLTSPQYSDRVRPSCNVNFCTFECSYSSVLRHIMVKLHILTRLMKRELCNGVRVMALYWSKIVDPSGSPC